MPLLSRLSSLWRNLFHFNRVSRDYFRTVGMQVRAGLPFSAEDGPKAQLAAIINETVARRATNVDPLQSLRQE